MASNRPGRGLQGRMGNRPGPSPSYTPPPRTVDEQLEAGPPSPAGGIGLLVFAIVLIAIGVFVTLLGDRVLGGILLLAGGGVGLLRFTARRR